MERKAVPAATLHKAAVRSTRASARLERREVPEGFRRTQQVQSFVAKRQKQR